MTSSFLGHALLSPGCAGGEFASTKCLSPSAPRLSARRCAALGLTAPRPAIMRRLLKRFGALGLLPQGLGQYGLPIHLERPGARREIRGAGRQPQPPEIVPVW